MSEFARCHYGYIQIPPVTTFRADGPETPEEEKGYWFHAYQPEDLCTIHNPMGDLQDFIALVKDAKKFGIDIIPDYTFNFMGIGVVVKMTRIIPLLIYERRSVKI